MKEKKGGEKKRVAEAKTKNAQKPAAAQVLKVLAPRQRRNAIKPGGKEAAEIGEVVMNYRLDNFAI